MKMSVVNPSKKELILPIKSEQKSYRCIYCNKNFSNRSILNRHIHIHTKEYLVCNDQPIDVITKITGIKYKSINYDYIYGHPDIRKYHLIKREIVQGGEIIDEN